MLCFPGRRGVISLVSWSVVPPEWLGREVFGSSGDLGIRRDGTHASHVIVEAAALVEKPATLSMEEAAGIGVPFVTALEGFRRARMPTARETVLILGVNGKVGQAAAQIAASHGANVIGVVRKDEGYEGHASGPLEIINSATTDVAVRVRELTDGKGAQIVFNTVGSPYFQAAHKSLAIEGRQILIATIEKVQFRHPRVLSWPTYLCGNRHAGFLFNRQRRSIEGGAARFCERASQAVPHRCKRDLSVFGCQGPYLAASGLSRDRVILRP